MSKAVLVMDMPSSCLECPIGQNESIPLETCIRCPFGKCAIDAEVETRPDWCPLRELPEKITSWKGKSTNYQQGHRDGYNACIDELLKGEEG